MGPLTLGPGHLWDQTGRCNRRSSWPAPLDRPRCSTERLRDTTCWTGAWEQTSHTCQLCPGPCSYLRMKASSRSHCQPDSCICLTPMPLVVDLQTLPRLKITNLIILKHTVVPHTLYSRTEDAEHVGQVTCRSGSQHASVIDAHWAVWAAHSQVIRDKGRNGYWGGCPSTVYQDILKSIINRSGIKSQIKNLNIDYSFCNSATHHWSIPFNFYLPYIAPIHNRSCLTTLRYIKYRPG